MNYQNKSWEKVRNSFKKEIDSETLYCKKYLKNNGNSYRRKINTNFHDNKIPKEDP